MLNPKFSISFQDLQNNLGLTRLDQKFLDFLKQEDEVLYHHLISIRQCRSALIGNNLINIACYLGRFLSLLFELDGELVSFELWRKKAELIHKCRRLFVERYALKKAKPKLLTIEEFNILEKKLCKFLSSTDFEEYIFSEKTLLWLQNENLFPEEIETAVLYASHMVASQSEYLVFAIPEKIDRSNLLSSRKIKKLEKNISLGFDNINQDYYANNYFDASIHQAKYCIYCHKNEKDSCRKGLQQENVISKKNGCPLGQKISEMNLLYAEGFTISALAVVMLDNPMVALTGHRICNDCMKSCIFQNQEPVNIPLIESAIVKNILSMKFGAEIYLLLTKWNPLHVSFYLPQENLNKNIAVIGLGPSGIASCYYMLKYGFNVVGIDGFKISPLQIDPDSPIENWSLLTTRLSQRLPAGFGGVAEYGITNRWDKNNLLLMRIMLARFAQFTIFDSVRVGSNIHLSDLVVAGFDAIILGTGAGAPKIHSRLTFLGKGVRTSSEFLMTLQYNKCLVRFPVVIVGLGLSAVDTATQLLHYYPAQVERFLQKYELLEGDMHHPSWSKNELLYSEEFLSHARLFREYNDSIKILHFINHKLGGVKILYHKDILQESSAYIENHEELEYAIAMGVQFNLSSEILSINRDENRILCSITTNKGELAAKELIIATGSLANKFIDIDIENHSDIIKIVGDANPKYKGSVVKAIASAKTECANLYNEMLLKERKQNIVSFEHIISLLEKNLFSIVLKLIRNPILPEFFQKNTQQAPSIVEIYSPIIARNCLPLHIFRLQFYEDSHFGSYILSVYKIDKAKKIVSFMIFNKELIDILCKKVNMKISLMGPVGKGLNFEEPRQISTTKLPLKIEFRNNILFIGENYHDAAFAPMLDALKTKNINILYIGLNDFESKSEENLKQMLVDIDTVFCFADQYEFKKRTDRIGNYLKPGATIYINMEQSMSCMMKGICGKCIYYLEEEKAHFFACDHSIVELRL